MAYASISDLTTVGLLSTALGSLTPAQQNAALQNASDFADTFFRNRYGDGPSPILQPPYDTQVVEAVAQIAAFRLVRMRGFNPERDGQFLDGYNIAVDWLNKVQRQQADPVVVLTTENLPGGSQPFNFTASVINLANGGRARNRGW